MNKEKTKEALRALERILSYTNGLGDGEAYTIRDALDRIISEATAESSNMAVLDGYKLVPIEPTELMIMAGIHAQERNDDLPNLGIGPKSVGVYKSMISAAPMPQQGKVGPEKATPQPDLTKCPKCGGEADNAVPEWQQIETAPKDGTEVILSKWSGSYATPETSFCWAINGYFKDGYWYSKDPIIGKLAEPTHWMPLSQPPIKGED